MTAETVINAVLPPDKYTSRMGNALFVAEWEFATDQFEDSGSIMVTDKEGKVLLGKCHVLCTLSSDIRTNGNLG